MIKLIYEQEPDYFDDVTYPERHLEVIIDDDDDLDTLFYEVASLAQYVSYVLNRNVWNSIGDYLEERGLFPSLEEDEYEQLTFNFDDVDLDEEEEEDEC